MIPCTFFYPRSVPVERRLNTMTSGIPIYCAPSINLRRSPYGESNGLTIVFFKLQRRIEFPLEVERNG